MRQTKTVAPNQVAILNPATDHPIAVRAPQKWDFGGRLYPLVQRKVRPGVVPIPKEFQKIGHQLIRELTPAGSTPEELAKSYAGRLALFAKHVEDTNRLLGAVCKANGFEFSTPVVMAAPPVPGVRLYAQGLDVARTELKAIIHRHVTLFVNRLLHVLDAQVERKSVGLISWASATMCEFFYYQFEILKSQTREETEVEYSSDVTQAGTWHTTKTTTKKHLQAIHRFGLHAHELVDAKPHPYPAPDVERPTRVAGLESLIPEYLKPHLRFVTGQQVVERTAEVDLKVETWTEEEVKVHSEWVPNLPSRPVSHAVNRWDPALTLGHYVLVGYDDRELAPERHEKVSKLYRWLLGGWLLLAVLLAWKIAGVYGTAHYDNSPAYQADLSTYRAAQAAYDQQTIFGKVFCAVPVPDDPEVQRARAMKICFLLGVTLLIPLGVSGLWWYLRRVYPSWQSSDQAMGLLGVAGVAVLGVLGVTVAAFLVMLLLPLLVLGIAIVCLVLLSERMKNHWR